MAVCCSGCLGFCAIHCLPEEKSPAVRHSDKVAVLVESEKSAVIGSALFPDYVWLAAGGKSQLREEKLRVLSGRTLLFFPYTVSVPGIVLHHLASPHLVLPVNLPEDDRTVTVLCLLRGRKRYASSPVSRQMQPRKRLRVSLYA